MTYIFLETGKPATSEAVFIKTLIENLGYNISSNKVEFVNGYKNLVNDYVHPNLKGKNFTYISAMKMSSSKRRKLGNGEWMFDNAEYWSLESDYLKPLKAFLQQHCSKE